MWPQQPPFFYEFLVILFIKRKAMIEQKKTKYLFVVVSSTYKNYKKMQPFRN